MQPLPVLAPDAARGPRGRARWPFPPVLRRGHHEGFPGDESCDDGPAGAVDLEAAWSSSFPSTTAELLAARHGPRRVPTGVLVLGRGPVTAPDGSPVEGPLCVPVSAPVVLVAPPVIGRALVRSWRAQESVAGSAPQVAHVASLARARALSVPGAVLVVVEGTGECWVRRPHHPDERVPCEPWLLEPDPRHRPEPEPELPPTAGQGREPSRGRERSP